MKLLLFLLLAAIPVTSSLSTERAFTSLVGGSVSVPCHYDVKYRDHVKYWCKGYQWTYCDILKQTDSPHSANDKISISDDRTGGVFIVTMRRLEKEDAAWYWCAIKLGGTKEADQYFYLHLTVTEGTPSLSVTSNLITGSEGGSASVSCQYARFYTKHVKYWCRGREWATCETLVGTDTPQTGGEKVSVSDDHAKLPRFFTVTVWRLEKKDAGWYWCAVQKAGADERIPLYLTVTDALLEVLDCRGEIEQRMREERYMALIERVGIAMISSAPTAPKARAQKMMAEDDPEAYLVIFEWLAMTALWPREF
ncbi:polymeric immunoglobulin receptor-like [Polyodon spathula]|uniref:polymeric immunoglobulin receptor-like n=1 Tax=Polyodon spathula TaxID=7913 RepID=UPI001B7F7436|nr:polymeric immunoglobulin receptor-like [Polyodon spathula]